MTLFVFKLALICMLAWVIILAINGTFFNNCYENTYSGTSLKRMLDKEQWELVKTKLLLVQTCLLASWIGLTLIWFLLFLFVAEWHIPMPRCGGING